jgi:hypothetical protein
VFEKPPLPTSCPGPFLARQVCCGTVRKQKSSNYGTVAFVGITILQGIPWGYGRQTRREQTTSGESVIRHTWQPGTTKVPQINVQPKGVPLECRRFVLLVARCGNCAIEPAVPGWRQTSLAGGALVEIVGIVRTILHCLKILRLWYPWMSPNWKIQDTFPTSGPTLPRPGVHHTNQIVAQVRLVPGVRRRHPARYQTQRGMPILYKRITTKTTRAH